MRKVTHHSGGVDSSNHAAGGLGGSTTIMVVFVGCLCCESWSRNLSYVDKYQIYPKEG